MRFKAPEIELEFDAAHPLAQAIALYADRWVLREFIHDLMVTDVGRSQEEYDRIYAQKILEGLYFVGRDGTKHYAGPRPHIADPLHGVPSHAVDFRVVGEIDHAQAERIVEHLNAAFSRTDGKPTAIHHDVGAGPHIHVQAKV